MATAAAPVPLRPPSVEIDGLPRLLPFKYAKTEDQVFTHRSYFARSTTVFEDPPNDPSPDNEVLQYIGDSVLSMAVGHLTKKSYPGLRTGPHAKIRSLVTQVATMASISEHYGLSKRLRANQSQLMSLQRSVYVQGDLFEAYIGGLYDDWGWEYVRPWLHKVLLPYVQEAYRIVQGSYFQSQGYSSHLGGGTGPSSAPICPADGLSSYPRPQIDLGVFPSPHLEGPPPSYDGSTPLVPNLSPDDAFPPSLIPE